jgi:hypothetical protein
LLRSQLKEATAKLSVANAALQSFLSGPVPPAPGDPKDKDYFFDFKEVNKLWDEDVIKVFIYNVRFDGDSLIFKSKITIYGEDFDIYILVDFDQNVEFGSEQGPEYIELFENAITDELEYFQDMFSDVYDELIPYDFWEVKSKVN